MRKHQEQETPMTLETLKQLIDELVCLTAAGHRPTAAERARAEEICREYQLARQLAKVGGA